MGAFQKRLQWTHKNQNLPRKLMAHIWHDWLYNPLLNFLFFLYSGPAYNNLGVAIIELTVLLRTALLPLTVLEERSRFRFEKLNQRFESIDRDFKTDHVMKKEKIRELLKTHKVSYWSKVIVLGVQLLVLILLYQVFVGGIRFTYSEVLYSWVSIPLQINTQFFGFDIGQKSSLWALVVGAVLFAQIYTVQKQRAHLVTRSDVIYMFLFPIFSVVILLLLPMVKSLFVLTSLFYSMIVFQFRRIFFHVPSNGPLH